MPDSNKGTPEQLTPDQVELLREMEQSKPDSVKKLRAHTRVSIQSRIIAQPGNYSDRLKLKLQGMTGDISPGGCQTLFSMPISVGDIYLISFTREEIDLSPVYARCMRCRIVREGAFEAGFMFFSPVDLSSAIPQNNESASLI